MKPSMSPRFQASAWSLSKARKSFSTCESWDAVGKFNPASRVLAAIPVTDATMTMTKQVRNTLLIAIHIGHLLFSHAARRIDDTETGDKYERRISSYFCYLLYYVYLTGNPKNHLLSTEALLAIAGF